MVRTSWKRGAARAAVSVCAVCAVAAVTPMAGAGVHARRTFTPAAVKLAGPESFPTGTARPVAVDVADLNGDGHPDAVVVSGDNTVSVLLGKGDGTFGDAKVLAEPSLPYMITAGVATADFDGDGHTDLAVSGGGPYGYVLIYRGTGGGDFADPTVVDVGWGPNTVKAVDVTGDGKPDLVTANYFANNVSVAPGRGDGTFGPDRRYDTGATPQGLAVARVDRDRAPDILTANFGSPAGSLSVLTGRGDGTFEVARASAAGETANDVATGDFNRDGVTDVAVVEYVHRDVQVLLGLPGGRFAKPVRYGIGPGKNKLAVADVNGDGRPDIITTMSPDTDRDPGAAPPPAGTGAGITVLTGRGDGTFAPKATYETGGSVTSVAVADLNGDHRPDVVGVNAGTKSLVAWRNLGS